MQVCNVFEAEYTPSTLTRLADGFGLKVPYGISNADSPQELDPPLL